MLPTRSLVFRLAFRNTQRPGRMLIAHRAYATPSTPPLFKDSSTQAHRETHDTGLAHKASRADAGMFSAENPYKGGQSALDKAMTMFLFTELVRGIFFLFSLLRAGAQICR